MRRGGRQPRLLDDGGDVADAAPHVLCRQVSAQNGVLSDTVLQGDDAGPLVHDVAQLGRNVLGVPQFHGDEHHIGGLQFRDGRYHRRRLDPEIAQRAAYQQSTFPYGLQMPAPGDEGDFVAPCGEPGAEVAPDTTRPHDGYTHDVFLPVRDMGVNRTGAGSTLSGWFATRGLGRLHAGGASLVAPSS